ncbi:hypothetical protein C1M14_000850, partial [Neisseria gonorrhoeae]
TTFCYNRASSPRSVWNLMKTLVLLLLSFSTTTAFAAYGLGLGQAPKYPAGFRAYGYVYSGRQGWVLKTEADAIKLDTLFKRFVYRPSAANQNPVGQRSDGIPANHTKEKP